MNSCSSNSQHCGRFERSGNRREFLTRSGAGFGMLALAGLLNRDGLLGSTAEVENPWATKQPHFTPRAKSVIWLFMEGGPSAMDTFDPKPELTRHHGKQPQMNIDVFFGAPGPLMRSPFGFEQYGQSGSWVCEHYRELARHVDEMAFIKSCYAESPNHGPAMYQMNTGMIRQGFPSAGAWVGYGLGSLNQNLPGFVVLPNGWGSKGGPANWGAGFLPSAFQGTTFRTQGEAILNLKRPTGLSAERQRKMLDLASELNETHRQRHPAEADLLARIQSYELAYHMQAEASEAVNLESEPDHIRNLYGLDVKASASFGRKCLMARRLVERGVRFVQAYCDDEWDAHGDIVSNHRGRCAESDVPIAGLLTDLKQRGLLDETLVVWGGEFGRMPISQRGKGRDHNHHGFLVWMAGGGIKGGVSYGATDEIGYQASVDPVSVHDLHATILHLLGIEHERLTYLHNGRRFRLTDVHGNVLKNLLS